jgi:hypothetical protein
MRADCLDEVQAEVTRIRDDIDVNMGAVDAARKATTTLALT